MHLMAQSRKHPSTGLLPSARANAPPFSAGAPVSAGPAPRTRWGAKTFSAVTCRWASPGCPEAAALAPGATPMSAAPWLQRLPATPGGTLLGRDAVPPDGAAAGRAGHADAHYRADFGARSPFGDGPPVSWLRQ